MESVLHEYLLCSNCDAYLVDLWINPLIADKTKESKVKANCPFCGDESWPQTFKNVCYQGGVSRPKPDDDEEVWPSTTVEHVQYDEEQGLHIFKVVKNGEPIYKL